MSAHKQSHIITSTTDHAPGTNNTVLGTEGWVIVEKTYDQAANANTLAQRDANGDVIVPTVPTSSAAAASKAYVDAVQQGLDIKASVRMSTTAALPTNTRSGNVLTASANGALAAQDGVTPVVNNDILVKDEVTTANNGIYSVTTLGNAGTPWVLTRRADANTSAKVTAGMFTYVTEGTLNADSGWVLTTNDPIVLNTDPLLFSQFSGAGQIVQGDGIVKAANKLSAKSSTAVAPQQYGGLVVTRTTDGSAAAGADAGFVAAKTDNVDINIDASNQFAIKGGTRLTKPQASFAYAATTPSAAECAAALTVAGMYAFSTKVSSSSFLVFRQAVNGGDPLTDFHMVELA